MGCKGTYPFRNTGVVVLISEVSLPENNKRFGKLPQEAGDPDLYRILKRLNANFSMCECLMLN